MTSLLTRPKTPRNKHSDFIQHLFGIDSIQLMIQSGFSKNESIHLVIQAIMKNVIRFDS